MLPPSSASVARGSIRRGSPGCVSALRRVGRAVGAVLRARDSSWRCSSWRSCSLGVAVVLLGHRGPPPPFGPAANGIIAFDAGGRIFVRHAGADAVEPLTPEGTIARTPVWSNDGSRMAYWARANGGGFALVIGLSDGTKTVTIPVEPAVTVDTQLRPAWAPDGDRIAFTARDHGVSRIYVVGTGGSNQLVAVTPTSLFAANPEWSPDGHRLSMIATAATNPSGKGDAGVYVVDPLFPSDPERLPTSPLMPTEVPQPPLLLALHAHWLPDPDRAVLLYSLWTATASDIAAFDLASQTEVAIMREATDDWDPTWSPDGTRIAWHRFNSSSQELVVMPIDASDRPGTPTVVLRVATSPVSVGTKCGANANEFGRIVCDGGDWSPDGRSLFGYDSQARTVLIIPVDGSMAVERLAGTGGTGANVSWQRVAP